MEEDRSGDKILSQKKSSIDDIIDHITADLQSYDGKYILLGQPSNNETQSIWQQRVTRQPENLNYVQNPYQDQQARINSLDSNVFYPSNSFVDNSRSNYIPYVFSNSNQYQNSAAESHYNYIYYQQNSNHATPDYGLFNASNNYQNPHLIENLVGNWVPNQNGTYSPFGNSPHVLENCNDSGIKMHHQSQQTQHANTSNTFSKLGNNAIRRPRMVAEVRPMRPSYSDVLAKSVTQTVSPTNGAPAKTVTSSKVDATRVKPIKKKGNNVTKNGGPVLKRQHSSGSEEQMMNGVKSSNDKKTSPPNENHGWSSVEDLSRMSSYGEFEKECQTDRSPLSNLNNKKTNRKTKSVRQNGLTNDACSNKKVNNAQPENRKNTKKTNATSNNNLQWGVGKQTSPVRNEKKTTKTVSSAEIKKSVNANKNTNQNVDSVVDVSKSITTTKLNPRFTNVPTNHRKTQRSTKRREGSSKIVLVWKRWREKTSQYVMFFFTWFLYLLWDVLVMSFHLCFYLLGVIISCSGAWFNTMKALLKNLCTNPRNWWHQRKKYSKTSSSKKPYSNRSDNSPANLTSNISLPQTGEEAMKRLFACKGKDPYSILGVTKNCPDEVIKKYYKRQAVLVHPDKNNQPGAEEAFKILVHAFELIGEPERRKAYDRCVSESMEEEWEELSNLLSQLHKKMEFAANTIRCTNCGSRHKRSMVERPLYAARFCSQCKIHHSAREGDIWAESSMLGWLWRYYACMDGAVYDISEWAACQADNLRHLKPNTHVVQYRIVVGKHRPNPPPPTSPQPPPPPPPNCSEQDIEDFLSSLYGHGGGGQSGGDQNGSRFRKKSKRKK